MHRTSDSDRGIAQGRRRCFFAEAVSFLMMAAPVAALAVGSPASAQTAKSLAQVRKIYVEPFTGKRGAEEIRREILHSLERDSAIQIVGGASESDAVLKGTGEIWTKGYISNNPRATAAEGRPVYGGYLLVSLQGNGAQMLWSYLVTPGKFRSAAITSDLAGQAAELIATAIASGRKAGVSSAVASNREVVTIHGAGATFPAPLYQAWIQGFEQVHPNTRITYEAVGSEEGMKRLDDHRIDFAATDIPEQNRESTSSPPAYRGYATTLGAVVPIYNLPFLDRQLRFTPGILAGIYLGKIVRWNDPMIRAVNKGADLPNAPITVVHRSDGSGTTYAFTDFLTQTSPEWKAKLGVGSTIEWPVGKGAVRNDGVAAQVRQTPNSIGYVELTYAIQNDLNYGSVANAAGNFVSASLDSVAAAAQTAGGTAASIANAPGKSSYPISSFTWIVLPIDSAPGLDAMLQWMLGPGQRQCSSLGYAPLPRELATRQLQALSHPK